MKQISIITPSICRKDLHNNTLPIVLSILKKEFNTIKWFVNIDPIPSHEYIQETKHNLEQLALSEHIDIHITCPSSPCFFTAIKTLGELAVTASSPVMYLEDDWQLIDEKGFTDAIKTNIEDKQFISFTSTKFLQINFNPSIWGKSMFYYYFYEVFQKQSKQGDPEAVVVTAYRISPLSDVKYCNPGRFFVDAGSKWRNEHNLKKWNSTKIMTGLPITYVDTSL